MRVITYIAFMLLLYSCSADKTTPSYIKVIINGDAIKTDAYNKGVGAYYYSFYDLEKDSLVYLYYKFTDFDKGVYVNKAYEGRLRNQNFRDTFLQLFHALDSKPSGLISNVGEGNMYCGWEYYVEFNSGDTIKHYVVLAEYNEVLDSFYEFYTRLEHSDWQKKPVEPEVVNLDREVVAQMKRLGEYEKRETPYIFPECSEEINFANLTGRWRVVNSESRYTRKNGFIVRTLNKDGTFTMDRYDSGKLKELTRGTYVVDVKQKKIIYKNTAGGKMVQTVKQITDSCFTGIENIFQSDRVDEVKLNRF